MSILSGRKSFLLEPVVGYRSRIHHSKTRGLLFQKNDQSSGQVVNEWSTGGQQVVLSGLEWSRLNISIYDAIKYQN